jgi:hypothetical protein
VVGLSPANRAPGVYGFTVDTKGFKGIALWHQNDGTIGGGAHLEVYLKIHRLNGNPFQFDLQELYQAVDFSGANTAQVVIYPQGSLLNVTLQAGGFYLQNNGLQPTLVNFELGGLVEVDLNIDAGVNQSSQVLYQLLL